MKKFSLLTIAILFFTIAATAQAKEVIKFEETVHDFGTVKEEDGKIRTTFKFQNISSTPVFIKAVRASCGCTSPKWSKEPIAPNANGEIDITYSAAGRPGHFQKSVTITLSNGSEDFKKIITIKGKVTPRVRMDQPKRQNDMRIQKADGTTTTKSIRTAEKPAQKKINSNGKENQNLQQIKGLEINRNTNANANQNTLLKMGCSHSCKKNHKHSH